jgi:hypothetical protein
VSPAKLPHGPDPPPFWKKTTVRVALIAGCFTILAAILNSSSTLLKKSEPTNRPPATTANSSNQSTVSNSAPVTVNSSTPVTVNNNISTGPPNTPPPGAMSLVLEQFTLNTSESFFQLCTKGRSCTWGRWSGKVVHWEPSDEYWRFSGADYIRSASDDKKYKENPSFYNRHFQPVFDVVISNPLPRPIVLTAIDVIISKQTEYAQGDGEEPADAGIIKVINRYTVPVGNFSYDMAKYPVTESTPATPPLEIAPNRPGRFQVGLDNRFGNLEIYEMRLRFHFGANGSVQTDRFRLTF